MKNIDLYIGSDIAYHFLNKLNIRWSSTNSKKWIIMNLNKTTFAQLIFCLGLFSQTHATTINYQDTYPHLTIGTTIVGLELITELNPTNYGQAHTNGTEVIRNTNDFIAFDRISNIYKVDSNGSQTQLLDTKAEIGANYINNGSQLGLQYAVPHPEFSSIGVEGVGKIYTTTTESVNPDVTAKFFPLPAGMGLTSHHYDVISEWDLTGPTPQREILMVMETPYGDHNARWLGFGPDGHFYISVGDGGNTYWKSGDTVAEHGFSQVDESPLGSILRIKLDGNGGYSIPADNPFVSVTGTLSEKYASGLRNPQQCWWDKDGELFCGDIGQRLAEEVNHIQSGNNYGWTIREGEFCIVSSDEDLASICVPAPNYTDPLYAYSHTNNASGIENRAIGGVAICNECNIPELDGFFLNVDLASGTLMAFNPATKSLNELLFKDLSNDNIGTYADLTGLPRIEARLGSCGDNYICYSSRKNDHIYRLVPTISVNAPTSLSLLILMPMLLISFLGRYKQAS